MGLLSLSFSLMQWQEIGRRGLSEGTLSMSFFHRSNSGMRTIFSPLGVDGSSITILVSLGDGYLRVMIWIIKTPTKNMSSLSE